MAHANGHGAHPLRARDARQPGELADGTRRERPAERDLQILALSAVAIAATVFVYGLVAGIVKLDDLGLSLEQRRSGTARTVGRGILRAAPIMMKSLSILGTAAMFTVGGSIIVHGIAPLDHMIEGIVHPIRESNGLIGGVTKALLDALAGIIAGGIVVGVVTLFRKIRRG